MFISRKEFAEEVGVSVRTIDRAAASIEGFPRKVQLTKRKVGYSKHEVDQWLDSRQPVTAEAA